MKKSFFYLGNITDGAIYYCPTDRNIYLFMPQNTENDLQQGHSPDLSPLFTAAGLFGYLLLRRHPAFIRSPAIDLFLYCLFSAMVGLGIAFMLIGWIRRRMRKNSVHFVPLEKISNSDYQLIRKKVRKQMPLIYMISAVLLYFLITEPFSWQGDYYLDAVIFFGYFLMWAFLGLAIYFFSPIRWFLAMKALRQIRSM